MFAFALWDSKRRRLLIARSVRRPLYWGVFDKHCCFASEPKALLAHPAVKPSLNLQALRSIFRLTTCRRRFRSTGINKLPAAHKLTLKMDA